MSTKPKCPPFHSLNFLGNNLDILIRDSYKDLSIKYLLNTFPTVPEQYIREYFEFYSYLLIPTVKAFKKFVKNLDGGLILLNDTEIQGQYPPRQIEIIEEHTNSIFDYDLEILTNSSWVKSYLGKYNDLQNNPQKIQKRNSQSPTSFSGKGETSKKSESPAPKELEDDVTIECYHCEQKVSSNKVISCSESHCICQKCFKKQCSSLIRSKGTKLICQYSKEEDCSGYYTKDDIQEMLTPDVFNDLMKLGIDKAAPVPVMPEVVEKEKPLTPAEESKKGYLCILTRRLMREPVKADDGYIYEKEAIKKFVEEFQLSPVTFRDMKTSNYIPQEDLQMEIIEYVGKFPDRDPEFWEGKSYNG